jgi:hypothetical protein
MHTTSGPDVVLYIVHTFLTSEITATVSRHLALIKFPMFLLLLITGYPHAMFLYYTPYWLEEKFFTFHVKVLWAALRDSA